MAIEQLEQEVVARHGLLIPANVEFTVFASAARTEGGGPNYDSEDFENKYARGVTLFLNITTADGTNETLDVKVQAKDPVSGEYIDILNESFAQKTATGTSMITIFPGLVETANVAVSGAMPRTWRVRATVGSTNSDGSFTFSMGGCYHL